MNNDNPTRPHDLTNHDAFPFELPKWIGRYRVVRILGKGGFGVVYLAEDDKLGRFVAIKVPHRKLVCRPEDAEPYLAEARIVAALDHENIVPVYDVGSSEEFPCFVVSKFIEGSTLTKKIKTDKPSPKEAADLAATIAETLHYAHLKKLVHRDVKPGNILLDAGGKPYVADFGLALKEENFGRGPRYAGTLAYMSPEQARGEGHRVDGRSDIFSLGVVFYEMLTGRQPFRADSEGEVLEQITCVEVRPPRQVDDAIPIELERICLKALSKPASQRYTTARDMADDLRSFVPGGKWMARTAAVPVAAKTEPVTVVPKGLRSFDARDTDFFLELLPGPRDRAGLPEALRFWKGHIEETDGDRTFAVGLVYGPSGCGKSSLLKAGLLPRLATHVTAVYVEATAGETEGRLLKGLRKHFPDVASDQTLTTLVAGLRRATGLRSGKKALLVLDQFEQWLHGWGGRENTELVQALRQCDGGRVQCLILVRDDFWMATTRFLRELEVRLVEGENMAPVDLFDTRHAKKVLTLFGRAFGTLPSQAEGLTPGSAGFIDDAVEGLAREGKIIPVRLAVFAEMVKGKEWNQATLKSLGGMEGVGVTFLEEAFSSSAAGPERRRHAPAARAVLKALLPELGTDIRGNMQPRTELLEASGYADRPEDFKDLMRMLDRELRLVSPSDPEGADSTSGSVRPVKEREFYQLTHDYLVPALREWLTRKQKETRRGRAEIRLADQASLWNSKPETRNLPSWAEWVRIRLLTPSRTWTTPQRKMMASASRYHATRMAGLAAFLLVLVGLGVWDYQARRDDAARGLRDHLLTAATEEVPTILNDLPNHGSRIEPLLRQAYAEENDRKKQLHLGLALLRWDPSQLTFIFDRLFDVEPKVFLVLRGELAPHKDDLAEKLWGIVLDTAGDPARRLRAACALADYSPGDRRWPKCAGFVARRLTAENLRDLSYWQAALMPAGSHLLSSLASLLEEDKWEATERRTIIELYAGFAGGKEDAFNDLEERMSRGQKTSGVEQARRTANVAAALAALRPSGNVWTLLVHKDDPTLRSYLIERLGQSGVTAKVLKQRFDVEKDVSVRRALILARGGVQPSQATDNAQDLLDLYENDPDAGTHAAAGWVLRKSDRGERVRKIDERLATGRPEGARQWYVNKERATLSILASPGKSQKSGVKPLVAEKEHRFAIGATEVTVAEFLAFKPNHPFDRTVAPFPECPVNSVSWYDAAEYCNWLSDRDGIDKKQLCYQRKKDGLLDFVPDYEKRKGYRLPTEAEWEFACRAGARTLWSFGLADEELAGRYGRWLGNSHADGTQRCFPVGSLKPNDWGLFDMHGNVAEWCQESGRPQQGIFPNDVECTGRGGAYFMAYRSFSCDRDFLLGRKTMAKYIGFRLAQTQ